MDCTKLNCPMQAGTKTDNCGENCPWRTTEKIGDLISRAAAIDAVLSEERYCERNMDDETTAAVQMARFKLEKVPTVDAVPVVMCRDCKYGELKTSGFGGDMVMCQNKRNPIGHGDWLMPPEWFCADGERRDGE